MQMLMLIMIMRVREQTIISFDADYDEDLIVMMIMMMVLRVHPIISFDAAGDDDADYKTIIFH